MKIEIIRDTGKIDKNNEPVFDVVKTYDCIKNRKEAEKTVRAWKKKNNGNQEEKFYYRIANSYGILYADNTVTYSEEILGQYFDVEYLMRSWIVPYKAEIRKLKEEMRPDSGCEGLHQVLLKMRIRRLYRKIGRIRKFMNRKVVKFSVNTFVKVKDFICSLVWFRLHDRICDWQFKRRRINYFKKNGHDITESWGLYKHLLKDLKWNLKRLKEESDHYPGEFVEEIVMNKHKNDPLFDLNSAWSNGECTSPKVQKAALKLRDKTYDKICHEIDLYMFYSGIGNSGEDYEFTKDMKYFYFPETYKEIDWVRMSQNRKIHWDTIWDFVKKYGEGMWY